MKRVIDKHQEPMQGKIMNQDLSKVSENEMSQVSPLGRMMDAGASSGMNMGSVTIESQRAIAEARGQMQLAKMFPRTMAVSIQEFLEACKSADFAGGAFYSVPNRGSGPSIRFAEEVARCYGNFEYGHRELSRSEGKSEIEVYAWDKEKNNRSTRQITVMHVLDTQGGSRKLTNQTDIDNKIANVASKQIRGRILALVPKHMVMAGVAECKKTIAGNNDKPMAERILKVCGAFTKYGVTATVIERYLGHSLDETSADELADLIGIGNALKDGAKASEYFGTPEAVSDATAGAAIAARGKEGAADKNSAKKESAATKSAEKASRKANPEAGADKNVGGGNEQKATTEGQQQEASQGQEGSSETSISDDAGDDVF